MLGGPLRTQFRPWAYWMNNTQWAPTLILFLETSGTEAHAVPDYFLYFLRYAFREEVRA